MGVHFSRSIVTRRRCRLSVRWMSTQGNEEHDGDDDQDGPTDTQFNSPAIKVGRRMMMPPDREGQFHHRVWRPLRSGEREEWIWVNNGEDKLELIGRAKDDYDDDVTVWVVGKPIYPDTSGMLFPFLYSYAQWG